MPRSLAGFLQKAKHKQQKQPDTTACDHRPPDLFAVAKEDLRGGRRQGRGGGWEGRFGRDGRSTWDEHGRLRSGGDGGWGGVAGRGRGVCPADEQHLVDVDLVRLGAIAVKHHDLAAGDAVSDGNRPKALAGLHNVIDGAIGLRRGGQDFVDVGGGFLRERNGCGQGEQQTKADQRQYFDDFHVPYYSCFGELGWAESQS